MKRILFAFIAVLAIYSCAKENASKTEVSDSSSVNLDGNYMTFTVSSEALRTTMDENRIVSFKADEKIAVWSIDEADGSTAPHQYTTTTGGVNAEFTGDAPAGATRYYAAFPYSAGLRCENGVIKGLSVSGGSSGTGTGKYNSSKAVAVATTTGSSLYFKQVCALLKITVPSEVTDLKEIVIFNRDNGAGNTAGALAGTFNVNVSDDGSFVIDVTSPTFQSGFVGPDGSNFAVPSGDYYVPVLPAQLTAQKGIDLKITFMDNFIGRAFNGSGIKLNSAKVYDLGVVKKTNEYIDNGFETKNISNLTGNGGALSVVANPHKTSVNNTDWVLKNEVSGTGETSGYVQVATATEYGFTKFPSTVRSNYNKFRIKIWLGGNLYYPRVRRGSNTAALPYKINGVELGGDKDIWNANIKTDDWNVLEYRASDIDGGWEDFKSVQTLEIRPMVNWDGSNVSGKDENTNNRTVYIDDITFVLK